MEKTYKQLAYELLVTVVEAVFTLPWLQTFKPIESLLLLGLAWLFDDKETKSELENGHMFFS